MWFSLSFLSKLCIELLWTLLTSYETEYDCAPHTPAIQDVLLSILKIIEVILNLFISILLL